MASLVRRGLHIAGRQLFYIAVIVTVLLLIVLGSAAWLSSAVAERKDEIARWAGDKLGYQIEVESVGLYWLDFIPKIYLSELQISTAETGESVLHANQLYVGLDLWGSVQQQQAVVDSASITGATMTVQRDEQGLLQIAGVEKQAKPQSSAGANLPEWLTQLRQLNLDTVELYYQDALQPQLSGRYQVDYAELLQKNPAWQLAADISLPNHIGQQLSLTAELSLQDDTLQNWQATVETQQIQLTPLLKGTPLQGIEVAAGQADIDLKLSQQDAILNLAGEVKLHKIALVASTDAAQRQALSIDRLLANIDLQKHQHRWQAKVDYRDMQVGGNIWSTGEISAAGENVSLQRLSADFLRLDDITSLALLMSTPNAFIRAHQPEGDLYDVNLVMGAQQTLESLQFSAKEIAFMGNENIPGMAGLSLTVDWRNKALQLALDSQHVTLFSEKWLDEPLDFDVLRGQIQWQAEQSGWQLQVTELSVVNEDLNIQLAGSLIEQAGLNADMQLDIAAVSVPRWQAYVPPAILDANFIKWADDAFQAGTITSGFIRLTGDPRAYPYDTQPEAGTFELSLNAADVTLNYDDRWPNLTGVFGQVTSTGNNLTIVTDQGNISGYRFNGIKADIANLVNGLPQLEVTGQLVGEVQKGLDFLATSPLSSKLGPLTEQLSAEGESTLNLSLNVPLLDPKVATVKGQIQLTETQLFLSVLPALPITHINGQIEFTHNSVTADGVEARIFDAPAQVSILPEGEAIRVNIDTTVTLPDLAGLWQGTLPTEISGSTALLTSIDIEQHASGSYQIAVSATSDLVGVELEMPAPLKKSAQTPLPFELLFYPAATPKLTVSLAEIGMLQWDDSNQNTRMNLHLGGSTGQLPADGFSVTGKLEQLELSRWLAFASQWSVNSTETTADEIWIPNQIDANISVLQFDQQRFHQVGITAQKTLTSWQLQLAAEEFKGNVNWPLDTKILPTLHFDFVDIALPTSPVRDVQQVLNDRPFWPGFRLNVENLVVDEMKLGRLQALAIQRDNQWQLTEATLTSPALTASATAQWTRTDNGDQSRVILVVNSRDLATLLTDWGYQPVIEANRAEVTAEYYWPGDPFAFNRETLQGTMQLEVGSGELKEVDAGAAGRFFGLLSFAAIPRRLALDFSDLFRGGFDFSSIQGEFDFAQGIARTDNLTLRGDSALIEISGPINLVQQTYDQTVKMTPSVSSTLPLAGAVAGGPVGLGVGTALFLADQLAGKLFNREIINLISYRYSLTGQWNAPEMTSIRAVKN